MTKNILPIALFALWLVVLPGMAQDTNQKDSQGKSNEGLRKISSSKPDYKFKVRIDKDRLESTIETAISDAMQSVESALEGLEIEFGDINIDLGNLDFSTDPIIIDLDDLDINIDLDIDDDDFDFDIDDDDDFDWDNDWDNDDWDNDEDDGVVIINHKKDVKIEKKVDKIEKKKPAKENGLKKIN